MAQKIGTIVYEYYFNYFGHGMYQGKKIVGVSVRLAIIPYKCGEKVSFVSEPEIRSMYLSDAFQVSLDEDKIFRIESNTMIQKFLCNECGWEQIEAEVVGFTLDFIVPTSKEMKKRLPEQLKDTVSSEPLSVSQDIFLKFIFDHIEDFDTIDNKSAQVAGYTILS